MRYLCTLFVGLLILTMCCHAVWEALKFSIPFAGGIVVACMFILFNLYHYFAPQCMMEQFAPYKSTCSDKKNVKQMPSSAPEKEREAQFIFIFADWCGHCQKTKPVWKQLQQKVKKIGNTKITYRLLDAEAPENAQTVDAYNVAAYPFIILIKPDGKKKVFSEKRSVAGFTAFLQKHLKLDTE